MKKVLLIVLATIFISCATTSDIIEFKNTIKTIKQENEEITTQYNYVNSQYNKIKNEMDLLNTLFDNRMIDYTTITNWQGNIIKEMTNELVKINLELTELYNKVYSLETK